MGEPQPMGAFTLQHERIAELIDDALDAFGEPRMLPRRPHGALEPETFADNRRNGRADAEGMQATAVWLQFRAEVEQWNRSALGALLWAARQYRDALPAELHGERGVRIARALVGPWGLRADVPTDLPSCHRLANLYGTSRWAEVNRRRLQEAA